MNERLNNGEEVSENLARGKRADNGEWVFGELVGNYIVNGFYGEEGGASVRGVKLCFDSAHWIIAKTAGRYTGLDDKNGVKIFEEDIIRWPNSKYPKRRVFDFEVGIVTFVNGAFHMHGVGGQVPLCYVPAKTRVQVIGNMHDNPELLEVE